MANEIKKALEKLGKLEARYTKMKGIFDKSKTKRNGTIAKLQMLINKANKKQGEIVAKETKVLEDLAAEIATAKEDHQKLVEAIAQAQTEGQKQD